VAGKRHRAGGRSVAREPSRGGPAPAIRTDKEAHHMTGTRTVAAPPQPPRQSGSRAARRRQLRGWRLARLDVKATPYLFVSPYFLLFAVFGLFPLGFTVWVSLHRWRLAGEKEWVGLDNFTFLLTYGPFWNSVSNTLAMFVIATVPQLLAALFIANALHKRMHGQLAWRLSILAPMVTSVVAVAVVFNQMYGRQYGMVNWILGGLGVGPIDWRADSLPAWLAIASMVDWRWTGYNAMIYLAAMQFISRDLYEAAAIDGASPRRQFWSITVPQLKPVIIFTVFVSTIGGLLLFAEPMMFDIGRFRGGTTGQFQTTAMFIVELFRNRNNFGMAAAAAWILFALIVIVATINYLIVHRIRGTR
jgi:cellobiose transport system permease protein